MTKKICYFGTYDPYYPRNQILISGLKKNNCEVYDCNDRSSGIKHYLNLFLKFLKLEKKFETIIVGVLGYTDVPLAWFLAKIFKKVLVFDAFYSLHDTYVDDRQIFKKNSFFALKFFLQDFLCTHLADIVLLDTKHHAKHFVKKYKIRKSKVRYLYIGANENYFKPKKNTRKSTNFIVEFHGSFQNLQGVDFIIETANKLNKHKDIKFKIVGDGISKKKALILIKKYQLKNVDMIPWQNIKNIRKIISESDVSLGIFGKTKKANLVIPNKVYEAVALLRPIITMDSPASREVFTNEEDALLVSNKNPDNLAYAIFRLKNNKKLYDKICKSAYNLYRKKLTSKIIGKQLKIIIDSYKK